MSKDELEKQIIQLREDLKREGEEKISLQKERDKIRELWQNSKKCLEETKVELWNQQRQREEAAERQRMEITVYKKKYKHVLSEHHNEIVGLKMHTVEKSSLIQNQYTEAELWLQGMTHSLQKDLREREYHTNNNLKTLQLKNQIALMELIKSYDMKIREVKVKYHMNVHSVMEEEERKQRAEINKLEQRMASHITTLVEEHAKALTGAEEYYSAVQRKLLEDKKMLKDELAKAMKQQVRADKELLAAKQENKCLKDSLQEAKRRIPEIQTQLGEHKQARANTMASRARVKLIDKELRDVKVERELLLQAFQKTEQECDGLLQRQTEAILEMQQKTGLRALLLEKMLMILTKAVEKTEARFYALLSASNIDQTEGSIASTKLEEMLKSKQVTIDTLWSDLAQDCQEYDELLQTYKERLEALNVPLHNLPLRSSKEILFNQARACSLRKPNRQ